MNEFDIPIFKKTYDLYKILNSIRASIPKQDRYTLWQRTEQITLDLIELFFEAAELYEIQKLPTLEKASVKLNLLRVFIRLSFDTKSIDGKKYTAIQQRIDEIGRMLGGWIKLFKIPENNQQETESAPL
ncbi:TPA: diversity-generating retroelement protein Avd [Candidatus Uhrbacteria bacterium]|nr:MAG: hypothetical protein UU60_C0021G0001 [Candidatus Uhrbacteria bacterium GW2011_GWB2_41_36]KKS50294.1 MAG: hypothetical protein UV15_C0023G0001 [Candidatus Uhrbacteria bacterium GW2011_GWA2_42_220]HAL49932.1 diversity-generating retroelement protein Avd [Candidatus Uhrbacteria bacterium]